MYCLLKTNYLCFKSELLLVKSLICYLSEANCCLPKNYAAWQKPMTTSAATYLQLQDAYMSRQNLILMLLFIKLLWSLFFVTN